MLSLPLIPPQGDMWSLPNQPQRSDSPPPANGQNPQLSHRQRQQRDEEKKQFNAKSALVQLAAEEAAIEQRKAAVRNFGAYWIRPPGVPKTLQAMTEEDLERAEQAELERQERGLLDMQAQQQLEEARQRADEAADQGDAEDERDLDDEIPEAEATVADVTFNEDSMMEGSQPEPDDENGGQYAEMEEAELTGVAMDEQELGVEHERDLDDSVPEAGEYQHTDTEVEASDSDSELENSVEEQDARLSTFTPAERRPAARLQERMRAQLGPADTLPRSRGSLNLSSSVLESSLIGSSPMLRANQGGGGRGGLGRRGNNT